MGVLPACLTMCDVSAWCLWKPQKNMDSSGLELQLQAAVWVLRTEPMCSGRTAVLTTEPLPSPPVCSWIESPYMLEGCILRPVSSCLCPLVTTTVIISVDSAVVDYTCRCTRVVFGVYDWPTSVIFMSSKSIWSATNARSSFFRSCIPLWIGHIFLTFSSIILWILLTHNVQSSKVCKSAQQKNTSFPKANHFFYPFLYW